MNKMVKVFLILVILLLLTFLLPTFAPALRVLLGIFMNMFIAAGLAYVSYPLVKYLRNKGLKNSLASSITLFIFLLLIIIVGVLSVQLIYPQIIRAIELVQNSSDSIAWLKDNPQITKAFDYLSPYIDKAAQQALDYFANTTQLAITKSTKFIADFALISCLYLYILFDSERIVKTIKEKLVFGTRNYNFVKSLNKEYMNYLKGLIIIIAITVVEYGVIYYLIGHPDWMALAALCAFSNLIPYYGGIIVNLIALATSIFVSPALFIKVLICVIVLPTFEGNVLNPMVHKKTISISPIVLLPAIFIGSSLFGFIGILLSIPAIILYKVFKEYYGEDIKKYIVAAWNS
ncbi:putative PurR-regulated permease PerM [Bacilli bacterium PM5-3]|nr:putative PurR-regulated permease PerM [Bacilli bacterium PM5-3]MDH6604031.1 putative PurR-regulated permease PerM [Bacilli bacterium PM5-9]